MQRNLACLIFAATIMANPAIASAKSWRPHQPPAIVCYAAGSGSPGNYFGDWKKCDNKPALAIKRNEGEVKK